jgi:hypothetical protein
MLHNLFYILPLSEILLYSLVLYYFILSFFPFSGCVSFVRFLGSFSAFYNIRESLPFDKIPMNSITEINIKTLNLIDISGWITDRVGLKGTHL